MQYIISYGCLLKHCSDTLMPLTDAITVCSIRCMYLNATVCLTWNHSSH